MLSATGNLLFLGGLAALGASSVGSVWLCALLGVSVVARDAGHVPTLGRPPVHVAGASAAGLLVDRRALEAVGGLPECEDADIAVFELCRRLRARGGRIVAVPDAVVVDDRSVSTASALTRPLPAKGAAWHRYVERHGPALMRDAAPLAGDRLRIALTDRGYDPSAVASGEEAVAAVEQSRPDVVLLDLGMPGIGGLEACRRIRSRRQ